MPEDKQENTSSSADLPAGEAGATEDKQEQNQESQPTNEQPEAENKEQPSSSANLPAGEAGAMEDKQEQKPSEPAQTPQQPTASSGSSGNVDIMGGKDLNFYVKALTMPVIILAVGRIFLWVMWKIPVLGWIAALISTPGLWLLKLGVLFWVGWQMVKKHGGNLINSMVAGAFAGATLGIISLVLNIVDGHFAFYSFYEIVNSTVLGLILALIGGLIAGGQFKK